MQLIRFKVIHYFKYKWLRMNTDTSNMSTALFYFSLPLKQADILIIKLILKTRTRKFFLVDFVSFKSSFFFLYLPFSFYKSYIHNLNARSDESNVFSSIFARKVSRSVRNNSSGHTFSTGLKLIWRWYIRLRFFVFLFLFCTSTHYKF